MHPGFAINRKMVLVKCICHENPHLMWRLQVNLKILGTLMYNRVPAFFWNLAALQHMNWYCRLITNLKYLCKILIHYDPQASWIYFINVLLCSDFSRLVGCGGSIFYWDIRDLWSVYNTNSCIEVPQDSKKMLVT